MMNRISLAVLMMLCLAPFVAHAQDSDAASQQMPQDPMSYSYLQINHLALNSDYFNDRSAGNGIKFSYDFPNEVYLFGQWNRLDFDKSSSSENLAGFAIGTHQAYNERTSFFVDIGYYRDAVNRPLGGISDNYWRVTYGLRGLLSNYVELDAAIFTERNTDFGRRPFGERLGLGFKSEYIGLMLSGEHTANGNRVEASLSWFYK
ncbi:MAG TPA: hypothetical protein VFK12_03395 [Gammaproteobacteria bacterium]|jgi:hypothetical protein|nr:hypothetical protein [Gammaproteobacteria bacterium]